MSHPDPLFDPENELPEDVEDRDVPTLNDTLTEDSRDQEDYLREKEPFLNQAEEDLEVEAIKQNDNEQGH